MRIPTLILYLLLCVVSAYAKDVITKTDGSTIDAKVEEITESVIKYRKASNTTGPIYTIPIASVATILYENGSIDTFNSPVATTSTSTNQSTSLSDEELLQLDKSHNLYSGKGYVSDTQLVRMSYGKTAAEKLYSKAKICRIIGWVGGTVICAAGIVGVCAINPDSWAYELAPISGAVVGVAWCVGFNLYANKLKRQARKIESYSVSIIENEIFHFGSRSLIAGVSVMGNHMTHTKVYGISLKFNL